MQLTITAPWHEFRAAVDLLHRARTHGHCPNELEWALAEECLTPPLPCAEFTAHITTERAFRAAEAIINCVEADLAELDHATIKNALLLVVKLNSLVHLMESDFWGYWHLDRRDVHYT